MSACSMIFGSDCRAEIIAQLGRQGAAVTVDESPWTRAVVTVGNVTVTLTSLPFVARGDRLSKILLGMYTHTSSREYADEVTKREVIDFVLRTKLLIGVIFEAGEVIDEPVCSLINDLAAGLNGRIFDGLDVVTEI